MARPTSHNAPPPNADPGEPSPPRAQRRSPRGGHALGRRGSAPPPAALAEEGPPAPAVHPMVVDEGRIDPDAAKVVRRLTRHGYQAYLVGGCVRDLLVGRKPKDFDVATSARPDDVRRLFRNSRIIGRRFRLVHVLFGGGKVKIGRASCRER